MTTSWKVHHATVTLDTDKDFMGLNRSAIKEKAVTAHVSAMMVMFRNNTSTDRDPT